MVEPKPGAAGRVATGYVATQEPDGYTLMMLTAGDGVTAAFDQKLAYDLLKDYAFIATAVHTSLMIVVGAELPLKSVRDLIEAGKSKPGGLTFGTPGAGTTQHLTGELLKAAAGINLVHVPYRENAFPDLIGGRLDLLIAAPSVSVPQIASGRVRAIAVTSRARIDAAKEVPAVGETLPDFDVSSWLGLAAPVKTDGAIVERLAGTMRQVLERSDRPRTADRDRQRCRRVDRQRFPRARGERCAQMEVAGRQGAIGRVTTVAECRPP